MLEIWRHVAEVLYVQVTKAVENGFEKKTEEL